MNKLSVMRKNGSRRVILTCDKPSRVEQSHRDPCDINTIVARYRRTGIVPKSSAKAIYGDFTGVSSYQDACDAILMARNDFMALPASVRKRFNNDPGQLLSFLEDVDNKAEAVKLGLIDATPDPVSPVIPPVADVSAQLPT